MDVSTIAMDNGVTVGDWLGTAASSAYSAALLMNRVRNGETLATELNLKEADEFLTQATDELLQVRMKLVQEGVITANFEAGV